MTDRGTQGIQRGGKGPCELNCPAKSFGIQPNGSIHRFYSWLPLCTDCFNQRQACYRLNNLTGGIGHYVRRRIGRYITDKSLSQTAGGHDFNLEIIPEWERISIRHFH